MSGKLAETIHAVLVKKGVAQADDMSLANQLAEELKEQPPGWDWSRLRRAWKNPGVYAAVIGILLTGLMLYATFNQTQVVREKLFPSIIVMGWLVLPPIYFFIELYLRGTSKEARELVQIYQQAAQRIWLAIAAVLIALYGLSFKC